MNAHCFSGNPFRFFDSITGPGGLVSVPDLKLPYESALEVGSLDETLTYGQSLDLMTAKNRLATIRRLSNDRWVWFRARLAQVSVAADAEAVRHEKAWAAVEVV